MSYRRKMLGDLWPLNIHRGVLADPNGVNDIVVSL